MNEIKQHFLFLSFQVVAFVLEAFFAEMELETTSGSEEDKVCVYLKLL